MGATGTTQTAWHTRAAGEVAAALGSDPARGLSPAEAADRLRRFGPNELQAAAGPSPWALLAGQFENVLIVILLVAVALSALLGHVAEALAITAIVLFAVGLGFVQEYRAERALDALRRMTAPAATVVRGGAVAEIPAREVVPGDVVIVRTGDRVPADGRIVESVNLEADEAPLTGESTPVGKDARPLADPALAVGDRRNMLFAGTTVTRGRGRMLVVDTGMQTEFGRIAALLETVEEARTPLQENLDRVGHALARAALAVVALIVGLGVWRGQPLLDMFIFGVALAVAVVPEALPAVVTISLALGVQRMARRQALIRRLPAVETLGCTSVICADKTGTLTRDEMTVRTVIVGEETFELTGAGYDPHGSFRTPAGEAVDPPPAVRQVLRAAALASDAAFACAGGAAAPALTGDPTERALVVAAAKAGLPKAAIDADFPRVAEIPFTAERKRMTTLHRAGDGSTVACAKGAPEVILASCSRYLTAAGIRPLDRHHRDAVLAAARSLAAQALRVLAIAEKPGAGVADAEEDLTFLGLVGLLDPPRPEARAAVEMCRRAGIRVVMITGDHPVTAEAVAREIGLLREGRAVSGADLDTMSDEDLRRLVPTTTVFARVSPAHKLRVVSAWQANGQCVAMTGDGVNDAPALKKAAIGIAMGRTGTDVTREAAAMTLADDNFRSIVAAVEEGRGVFENIKKYLMYLLSSNIGEIGLMAGAVLLGLPLPLSAVQILYVNLATDGLPALALAVDPPDRDLMRRPPRDPRRGIFTRPVVILMLAGGAWSAVVNVSLFAWTLHSGRPLVEASSMTFLSLVLIQFFKAYNYRSDRWSVLQRPLANVWLNRAIAWELTLLGLILYVPFLREVFGTAPLSFADWSVVVGIAATVSPLLEAVKWMVRRGWLGPVD